MRNFGKRRLLRREGFFCVYTAILFWVDKVFYGYGKEILTGPQFKNERIGLMQLGYWLLFLAPMFLCMVLRIEEAWRMAIFTCLRYGKLSHFWTNLDKNICQDCILYLITLWLTIGFGEIWWKKIVCTLLLIAGMLLITKVICLMLALGCRLINAVTIILLFHGVGSYWLAGNQQVKRFFPVFWMMENCSRLEVENGFSVTAVLIVQMIMILCITVYQRRCHMMENIL